VFKPHSQNRRLKLRFCSFSNPYFNFCFPLPSRLVLCQSGCHLMSVLQSYFVSLAAISCLAYSHTLSAWLVSVVKLTVILCQSGCHLMSSLQLYFVSRAGVCCQAYSHTLSAWLPSHVRLTVILCQPGWYLLSSYIVFNVKCEI